MWVIRDQTTPYTETSATSASIKIIIEVCLRSPQLNNFSYINFCIRLERVLTIEETDRSARIEKHFKSIVVFIQLYLKRVILFTYCVTIGRTCFQIRSSLVKTS